MENTCYFPENHIYISLENIFSLNRYQFSSKVNPRRRTDILTAIGLAGCYLSLRFLNRKHLHVSFIRTCPYIFDLFKAQFVLFSVVNNWLIFKSIISSTKRLIIRARVLRALYLVCRAGNLSCHMKFFSSAYHVISFYMSI